MTAGIQAATAASAVKLEGDLRPSTALPSAFEPDWWLADDHRKYLVEALHRSGESDDLVKIILVHLAFSSVSGSKSALGSDGLSSEVLIKLMGIADYQDANNLSRHFTDAFRRSNASRELISTMYALHRPSARKGPAKGTHIASTSSNDSDRDSTSIWNKLPPHTFEFIEAIGDQDADLQDALRDLDEAAVEAQEEEFPIPSDVALANARRLLPAMYKGFPRRFEVYPTPDGEVAIDAPGGRGRSVLLLCDSGGGALCLVNINGKHRRARYSDTNVLPDGFIREALDELAQGGEPVA